jgi:dTDP-4-dehydrorhamnose reductase
MFGHKLFQILKGRCEVFVTFRHFDARLRQTGIFDPSQIVDHVDAWDMSSVEQAVTQTRPTWVVNCVGVIKQLDEARDPKTSIYVNALFPHLLADVCAKSGTRVIHISTDCVFSGIKGDYTEDDPADADDLYGKTKFLGEMHYEHALTVRTSIVGRDLFSDVALIDWFLSQSVKTVKGYTNAIYTGLSTDALSREIWRIITEHPELHGLYHVSTAKITKLALLTLVNRFFQAGVEIEPYDGVRCDRSLLSHRYREAAGFTPPEWETMVREMANDPTPYDRFRKSGS